ncbi:MAG: hypothetical protein M3Z17_10305 [Gemmatimonadota bacterium]|nr:hypothetical protein [Gemmatimonadota bacterium]
MLGHRQPYEGLAGADGITQKCAAEFFKCADYSGDGFRLMRREINLSDRRLGFRALQEQRRNVRADTVTSID